MTKRALKRTVREGAFDQAQFHNDDGGKVRRLPVGGGWSPLGRDEDRDQGYLKTIKPKSDGQAELIKAIDAKNLVMALGPAGTGKTYLAVACAVDALERSAVQRIVLTRPAVEAGEKLGFLPGDLGQKVDPYLRPLYDALYDLMGFDKVQKAFERQQIEIAPLAFMRGRTLNHAFVILDEAQNTTPEQMKMFLTRLGFGSKMVVTGDITQVDLPTGASGLQLVTRVLADIDDIHFARLTSDDVVRHTLVGRIVDAYTTYDAQRMAQKHERESLRDGERGAEGENRAARRSGLQRDRSTGIRRNPRRGSW